MKSLALLVLALLITGCTQEWRGFVYPNKNDLSKHIELGKFDSLERCRNAAIDKLWGLGDRSNGDYECGLNCRPLKNPDGSIDINICEKTER